MIFQFLYVCIVFVILDACNHLYSYVFMQVPVITTTEFVQGRTHRWGIAWSFLESEKSKVFA